MSIITIRTVFLHKGKFNISTHEHNLRHGILALSTYDYVAVLSFARILNLNTLSILKLLHIGLTFYYTCIYNARTFRSGTESEAKFVFFFQLFVYLR